MRTFTGDVKGKHYKVVIPDDQGRDDAIVIIANLACFDQKLKEGSMAVSNVLEIDDYGNSIPAPMGMSMYVYRSVLLGDTTNGGITSKVKGVTVTGQWPDGTLIPRIFNPSAESPEFHFGKLGNRWHVYPAEGKKPGSHGWMFGGNFVHCSDSRGPDCPIHVHDRQEPGG